MPPEHRKHPLGPILKFEHATPNCVPECCRYTEATYIDNSLISPGKTRAGWPIVFSRGVDGTAATHSFSDSFRIRRCVVRPDVYSGADDIWLAAGPKSGRHRPIRSIGIPDLRGRPTDFDVVFRGAVRRGKCRSRKRPPDDATSFDDRFARSRTGPGQTLRKLAVAWCVARRFSSCVRHRATAWRSFAFADRLRGGNFGRRGICRRKLGI